MLREHLAQLCRRVELLPGAGVQAFIDIDSLLRPVYGYAKQGASYGHSKIAGKRILRKGLSPLATTISTDLAAPVIAGMRLRAGKTGSGRDAGPMVAQTVATARAAGVTSEILVHGDSAYGTSSVVGACRRAGVRFSLVLTKNRAVARAIAAIGADAWTPVKYPGAVRDPDTGEWISGAEVAEIPYTAFASKPDRITARLIVRRVKDAARQDELLDAVQRADEIGDATAQHLVHWTGGAGRDGAERLHFLRGHPTAPNVCSRDGRPTTSGCRVCSTASRRRCTGRAS